MTAAGDRVAFVTGTTSGVGEAVAASLLDRGWRVVGAARRAAAITHADYEHIAIDLSDSAAVSHKLESRVEMELRARPWARVGLVNNAARADLLGPIERVPPDELMALFALNVVTPVALMGCVVSRAPTSAALRLVNLSSGAAVNAFPGLAAYGASKAALRMAGLVLAAELDAPPASQPPRDAAILSYEPGTVDTPMQTATRAVPPDEFPWGEVFHRFQAEGLLVSPAAPAAEIVAFLESDPPGRFTERRLGRRDG